MFCTSGPHDQDGHVTVQIHLPLLTATLALQLKPGSSYCRCKSVEAADPTIKHADAPNVLLVQVMSTVKKPTLALEHEPGIVVVVSAKSVAAADPTSKQGDAPNVLMVQVMNTVKIHLPLLTATLVLQLELEVVVVVGAKNVIAAEPAIQHAYTPSVHLELERERVVSSHRPHAVPNGNVSTNTSETSTTTRHRDANTPEAQRPTNSSRSRQ